MRGPVVLTLAVLLVLSTAAIASAGNLADWGVNGDRNNDWGGGVFAPDWHPTWAPGTPNDIALFLAQDKQFGTGDTGTAQDVYRGGDPTGDNWDAATFDANSTYYADGYNKGGRTDFNLYHYNTDGLYLQLAPDLATGDALLKWGLVDAWNGTTDKYTADAYINVPVIGLQFGGSEGATGNAYEYALVLSTNRDGSLTATATGANTTPGSNYGKFGTALQNDTAALYRVGTIGNGAGADVIDPNDLTKNGYWVGSDDGNTWTGDGDKFASIELTGSKYNGPATNATLLGTGSGTHEYNANWGGTNYTLTVGGTTYTGTGPTGDYLWQGAIDLTKAAANDAELLAFLQTGTPANPLDWSVHFTQWCGNDRIGGTVPVCCAVPELGTYTLLALGLLPVGFALQRRRLR